jgi:transposase-like protein
MAKRKKRIFTREFKADAAKLCINGDRSVTQVAKDLDLTESTLRAWVAQARAETGPQSSETLTNAEREELLQLRRDVKRLQMERDILKKATTFFAKENA